MSFYEHIRPLIYRFSPEQAHHLTVQALKLAGLPGLPSRVTRKFFDPGFTPKPVKLMGLTFPNVLGLAAGYDKDAEVFEGLANLGFGHVEVGTVTPKAQPGNPAPRLFRLVEDQAVINRMGFNNQGADRMAARLVKRRTRNWVLGVNIGKNKLTPNAEAEYDYRILVEQLGPLADYLVVNVSSPNTPGLRDLQAEDALARILSTVERARNGLSQSVPLVLKLAPDLDIAGLDAALQCALDHHFDGVIVSNTTIRREGLRSADAGEVGGLSGLPLREGSLAVLKETLRLLDGALPVISSGGVMTPDDVEQRLDLGASLVQLYTGLIYAGPALVKRALQA